MCSQSVGIQRWEVTNHKCTTVDVHSVVSVLNLNKTNTGKSNSSAVKSTFMKICVLKSGVDLTVWSF